MRTRLTIAGTAALAAVLLAGCVQQEAEPTTAPQTPVPSASQSAPDASDESRCGVPGFEVESSLVQAPEADWSYVGSIAVPGADDLGPGEITDDGIRVCFAHTAAGAVTMAFNAAAQANDASTYAAWADYFFTGPGRDEVLANADQAAESTSRIALRGFRVLAYDGSSARVDVALQVDGGDTSGFGSGIYELVWEDGDWRILAASADESGVSVETISSLTGYTLWNEE